VGQRVDSGRGRIEGRARLNAADVEHPGDDARRALQGERTPAAVELGSGRLQGGDAPGGAEGDPGEVDDDLDRALGGGMGHGADEQGRRHLAELARQSHSDAGADRSVHRRHRDDGDGEQRLVLGVDLRDASAGAGHRHRISRRSADRGLGGRGQPRPRRVVGRAARLHGSDDRATASHRRVLAS
jgi:hypothetical protein